ncbi:MAG: gluconokinase [Pseudomonadota bacterium]|nr:gluconokinase [Pseudomonadota bacterium]
MGVAGCGKSSLGQVIAACNDLPLLEGDDFHSAESRAKMANGIALTDEDRADWLTTLSAEVLARPAGVVLTCSALKRAYRERLRQAAPDARFVFMDITPAQARQRVLARAATHFFSASLVDSQFATLERPDDEHGVLRVDAEAPLDALGAQVSAWLAHPLSRTATTP